MGVKARPNRNGKYHNLVGRFFPLHPEKVVSSGTIIYKSKLELRMMAYLDKNPKILQWSYEPNAIKYLDQSSNPPKVRNYYIDFVALADVGGTTKKIWIEVKSEKEVRKPKNAKNIMENLTWIKNQCKWAAARNLARSKGIDFVVITENQLI